MAKLTLWKSLRSDGTLPLDADVSQIRIRHEMILEIPTISLFAAIQSIGLGLGQDLIFKTIKYTWKYQIQDSTGFVLFEQQVEITLLIVALVISSWGAFNLSLFTWSFGGERITTTVINGKAAGPGNEPYKFTIGGQPTSEFGIMEKGGGSDFTDLFANVNDAWMSTVYKINIPKGAKLVVLQDTAGLGIRSRPEWSFSFSEAAEAPASWLDTQGAIRSLMPVNTRIFVAHTYRGPQGRSRRAFINNSGVGSIWKDATNRTYALVKSAGPWVLYYSDLDGLDMLPVLYNRDIAPSDEELVGSQVAVWRSEFRDATAVPRTQGGYGSIAMLSDTAHYVSASGDLVPGETKIIGPHKDKSMVLLVSSIADGRERLVATDLDTVQYESLDGGDSWEPIL